MPPGTTAAKQARLLIEQAEALREPSEIRAVVLGSLRLLGSEFVGLQRRCLWWSRGAVPGARGEARHVRNYGWASLMGISSLFTGDIAVARAHLDQAIALYDPAEHSRWRRDLAWTPGCKSYPFGPWLCGRLANPEAGSQTPMTRSECARDGQAATLMYALDHADTIRPLRHHVAVPREPERCRSGRRKKFPIWRHSE